MDHQKDNNQRTNVQQKIQAKPLCVRTLLHHGSMYQSFTSMLCTSITSAGILLRRQTSVCSHSSIVSKRRVARRVFHLFQQQQQQQQ